MPCSCACRQHDFFSKGNNDSYIHKLSHKKIKADVVKFMKTNDLLPGNARAICQLCIDYITDNLLESSKRKNASKRDDIIEDILKNVTTNELPDIAEALGKRISSDIEADSVSCSGSYRDPDKLCNIKIDEWLHERNEVLVKFLTGAAGTAVSPKKTICISTAVDSVYKVRRLIHIAPLQFCKNLVSYYMSGSKILSQLNNRQTACGSYSSLHRWLKSNAQQPLQSESDHDQVTFFDNNQVIARNWRVTFGHKTTASVITMLLNITPASNTTLQEDSDLSPRKWLHNQDTGETVGKIKNAINEGQQSFSVIRNKFLDKRLKVLIEETRGKPDPVQDKLDGFFGPRNKKDSGDPYAWVPSCHPEVKPRVQVGEPASCNPCSYDSVKSVLKHIQKESGVGDKRTWVCAGCDGLPYVLGSRLIDEKEDLRDVLLLPGLGNIEMTAVKACFKLLWDVCLEDLAKMLGFRTPRALMCCKACTNHHKSWMILTIFFNGTMDELLHSYILKDDNPTVQGLYRYIGNSQDKNFRFMCDVVFNYVLAIFVFRCGVRRNNTQHIQAGKSQFMKLFYGLNHTCYQEIMYRDLKARVLSPVSVLQFMSTNESFSLSGHSSKGEGGDFVLESYNRRSKRWLPPGIPQQHHWINVCRNLNLLEKIRNNTFKEMCITEESKTVYQRDLSTEIFEWRVKLRNTSYFSNTPDEYSQHTSLSGESLDSDLVRFEKTCQYNMNMYLDGISRGLKPGKGLSLTPVFTTPLDRHKFHDIEKKTKQQITSIVDEAISEIHKTGNTDEAFVLDGQWKKIKGKTKKDMLMFYKEVVVALENATAVESDDEDEENSEDDE